jgi:sulfur carrier protein
MLVTINGERRELPPEATVASVIESLARGPDGRGVAVAVAGEVVPRTAWAATKLTDGAQVEVVAAVQGG